MDINQFVIFLFLFKMGEQKNKRSLIFTKRLQSLFLKILKLSALIGQSNKLRLIGVSKTSHTGHNPEHVVIYREDSKGRDGLTRTSNE
jgi:hypothetical protein